jgi:hypothetical protein
VVDSETALRNLYTFTATDPSNDSLTCTLDETNPAGGPFSISQVSDGKFTSVR